MSPERFEEFGTPTEQPKREVQQTEQKEQAPKGELLLSFDQEALNQAEKEAVAKEKKNNSDPEFLEPRITSVRSFFEKIRKLPELRFESGSTFVFGENGSGKTTLMRAVLYAAQIQEAVNAGDDRSEAERRAYSPVMKHEKVALLQAGLAPSLSKAIRISKMGFGVTPRAGGIKRRAVIEFHDATRVKLDSLDSDDDLLIRGKSRATTFSADQEEFGAPLSVDDIATTMSTNLSQRQLIDRDWEGIKGDNAAHANRGVLRGFDEPETGMSPKRQLRLEKDLQELTPEGGITLVSTNSVKLYETDLPRIDLDHPERGIHRPSQYPDNE